MNFLAHTYLSGNNPDIIFGNFIGDMIKGTKYKIYSENIIKGILLHRKIDSYTDSHPTVKKSIYRLRPAYGKYAGVATDILYDHYLSQDWNKYSDEKLETYVERIHSVILENYRKLPRKSRRFAVSFIKKKRLLCYKDLKCFRDVLNKMSVYTSLPYKTAHAMQIISENYDSFKEEFNTFFPDIINYLDNNIK
ncbi:MAG: DUF479 domain-containing protein [Chlorobi bacterium]|nr:DUF479 domain-containing protein [Chlorobiota bacterium]